jgi:hypothetical protein
LGGLGGVTGDVQYPILKEKELVTVDDHRWSSIAVVDPTKPIVNEMSIILRIIVFLVTYFYPVIFYLIIDFPEFLKNRITF